MKNLKIYASCIEQEAIDQINLLMDQPAFADCKVRIMPDVHAGAGCVIGFTADLGDKVIPNVVGVDIGCLDKDTEVLTPEGWIQISEWNNQPILQYDKFEDQAYFELPAAYIKKSCDSFYHIHSKYGLDQMVSEEHKLLVWVGSNKRGYVLTDYRADRFVEKHNSLTKGFTGGIKTTFSLIHPGIDLTDPEIRIIAMISADGTVRKDLGDKKRVELHFRKPRKIERARFLLDKAGIIYRESVLADGTTNFYFYINSKCSKDLSIFFNASQHQLKVFMDEAINWDGTKRPNGKFSFSTTSKINADVFQYACAANGVRCGIHVVTSEHDNWRPTYNVYSTLNEIVGFPDRKFEKVSSVDGFKYCFTTYTGYFVIRRNSKISITGNCGMFVAELGNIEIDFEKLDHTIREKIPSGKNVHEGRISTFPLMQGMHCYRNLKDTRRIERSIGTLGGGNHFIEVDQDDDGNKYLVIHSGSRNLGKQVADHYQNLAWELMEGKDKLFKAQAELIERYKAEGRRKEIQSAIKQLHREFESVTPDIPKNLAYLSGEYRAMYLHDMDICQEYACRNRIAMTRIIFDSMNWNPLSWFETVHNYIDLESNIVRKGAVSAKKDERLIIPMNMRDGSLICIGKGNDDWNCSAPHGAGRLMSRTKAKETLSLSNFANEMSGIYTTSVSEETLDEAPMAYKPMEEIIPHLNPTVTIERIIKPVYNFKASE